MPLVGSKNIEARDGTAGIRKSGQQPQKSLLTIGNIIRGMECRIGIEVDPKRTAVQPVVNLDRQVFDRSKRKVSCLRPIARETKIIIEPHDIEIESEQRSRVVDAAKFPPQICNLKKLVFQSVANLPGGVTDSLGHGHAGMHGEPQRQDV